MQGTYSATELSWPTAQLVGSLPVPRPGQKVPHTLATLDTALYIFIIFNKTAVSLKHSRHCSYA